MSAPAAVALDAEPYSSAHEATGVAAPSHAAQPPAHTHAEARRGDTLLLDVGVAPASPITAQAAPQPIPSSEPPLMLEPSAGVEPPRARSRVPTLLAGLCALGLVAVAAVYGWQAWRSGDAAPTSSAAAAPMPDEEREPELATALAPELPPAAEMPPEPAVDQAAPEPMLDLVQQPAPEPAAVSAPVAPSTVAAPPLARSESTIASPEQAQHASARPEPPARATPQPEARAATPPAEASARPEPPARATPQREVRAATPPAAARPEQPTRAPTASRSEPSRRAPAPASMEPQVDEAGLREMLARDPHDSDARVALAALLAARGDDTAADQLLDEVPAQSDDARPLARLELLARLGRAQEAQAVLDALPASARASASARMSAARLALAAARPEDAVRELAPIADAPGASAPVLALYGRALLAAGRAAEASQAYAASAAEDRRLPEALLGRAEMAVRSRRPADALTTLTRLDRVLQSDPRPAAFTARALFLRGRAQLMADQRADARRTLAAVVQRAASPTEAWFFLAEARIGADYRGAREAYLRYLELEPDGYYARRARHALGAEAP